MSLHTCRPALAISSDKSTNSERKPIPRTASASYWHTYWQKKSTPSTQVYPQSCSQAGYRKPQNERHLKRFLAHMDHRRLVDAELDGLIPYLGGHANRVSPPPVIGWRKYR
jgi:hypothetical protein